MKIGEAVALDRQVWEDISQIPDASVQDRYLAMVEQTPMHQEAQAVLSGLAKLAPEFGAMIHARQTQLQATVRTSEIAPTASVDQEEAPIVETETEQQCEPLLDDIADLGFEPANSNRVAYVDNLCANFRQVKAATKQQVHGLGPRKAAKIQNREEKRIEDLFYVTKDESGPKEHIVRNPSIFAYMANEIIYRFSDQTRTQRERDEYREVGQRFLHSGEHYLTDHADELAKDKQFLENLLLTYAIEATNDPSNRGGAEHLLRGFFKSTNTPERAVERGEAIVQTVIDLYKYREAICLTTYRLLLNANDFFNHVPYIENLMAAQISYHKPDLRSRAAHLSQFAAFYYMDNLGIDASQTQDALKRLISSRDVQIQAAQQRAREEGLRVDPDYAEKARLEREDTLRIETVLNRHRDGHITEDAYNEYIALAGEPGPEFQTVFWSTTKLREDYEKTIGQANIMGNPLTDSVVIDGGYAIDFVFRRTFSDEERLRLRKDAIRECIVDRSPSDPQKTALEEIINQVETGHEDGTQKPAFRAGRVSVGSMAYRDDQGKLDTGNLEHSVYVRKRTLFDDEHTSPLTDFDVKGFNTRFSQAEVSDLVRHIDGYKTRFVPKRGIDVVITDKEVKDSGLSKLVIRSVGVNRLAVDATIHGHERTFQIKNNQFFDKRGHPLDTEATEHSASFASYCMAAIAAWMCRPKIETDEGVVVEGSHDSPIKGGYYSYLRVRESDGYKYKRDDLQWYLCADEKGEDLDEESKRLALLDPTGKMRNSTYVREHEDDGAHLSPLKVYL